MALLNYSTTVNTDKTLAEIQRTLAKAGAKSILVNYDGGRPVGLSFLIGTAFGDRGYKLPANIEPVHEVIRRQARQGKIPRRFVSYEQAARVGWRIIKDWLEAQLAIIETEMVTLDQVMLPYMTANAGGASLYEVMVEARLALPSGDE